MAMLKKISLNILKALGVFIFVVWTYIFIASFHDGPLNTGIFFFDVAPGGAFTSGELVSEEPDWSFAKDIPVVQFQIFDPVSSRTTFIMVHDNRIFIPTGYMTTWWGKIWKQWPKRALADGRAILRIDGKIYNRSMVRVTDDPVLDGVMGELARKYGGGGSDNPEAQKMMREVLDSGYMWIFELKPRA